MGAVWRGLRYSKDVGFEARCEYCERAKVACWWPLTLEFWNPDKGMTRCRACWNAKQRDYARRRASVIPHMPPAVVEARQEERRVYKREWAARRRIELREAEGRGRYQRRTAA